MTDQLTDNIRASRLRVARSRGALSGGLVVVLGAWSVLVPFIGTYLDLRTTPSPDDAWKWTAARGWLEVLPGAVAVVGGLFLLLSANRVVTSFGGWIAAAAGAWLVISPALAPVVHLTLPAPDPSKGTTTQAVTLLLTFLAIGAGIVLFAALALGRLSVHGIGDVRAAEKRARADAEREAAERRAAEVAAQRVAADRAAAERAAADRTPAERPPAERPAAVDPVSQHAAEPASAPTAAATDDARTAGFADHRAATDTSAPPRFPGQHDQPGPTTATPEPVETTHRPQHGV